uniref:Choline transporter-like protein n=1 Tax=Electrophorus electricus TaxID=8005 RepID=A0AAY5EAB8_ELEEL
IYSKYIFFNSIFSGEPPPYEPIFRRPVNKRRCADIICCIIFVAAIVTYILIRSLAWLLGDSRHVVLPQNSTGMFCGAGVNVDKPNVLYFDLLKCARATTEMDAILEGLQCPTTQVCVKKCPSEFWKLPPEAYAPNALPKDFFQQQYCDPRLDLAQTTLSVQDILNQELCPYFYTPSKPELGRCLPSFDWQDVPPDFSLPGFASVNETVEHIKGYMDSLVSVFNFKSVGVRIFEDFAISWYWILLHSNVNLRDIVYNSEFSFYLQLKETWMFFCKGYQIFLQDMCYMRPFVLCAVCKVVSCVTTTLAYPLVTFLLVVICVSYWGITSLYLATSGAPVYHVAALNSSIANCSSITGSEICIPQKFQASLYPDCPSVRCVFFKYDDTGFFSRIVPYLHIYNFLAFLWCMNFIIAVGQCTLAGTFASVYWAFSKPADIPPSPVLQAFVRTLRCHAGSLALGAVILTVFQVPRMVLEYLFVMMPLKCCFWFLDKFLKFFHRNTYIMIAIYGDNFSVSAKNAYMTCFTHIIEHMGLCLLAFFFFPGRIRLPYDNFQLQLLHYYWLPTVIVGAYFIAQGFFSVHSMCVDTLLLCFLEGLERNDGTVQRPYHMPRSLWQILHKRDSFLP